jgi:hypothetical protein
LLQTILYTVNPDINFEIQEANREFLFANYSIPCKPSY